MVNVNEDSHGAGALTSNLTSKEKSTEERRRLAEISAKDNFQSVKERNEELAKERKEMSSKYKPNHRAANILSVNIPTILDGHITGNRDLSSIRTDFNGEDAFTYPYVAHNKDEIYDNLVLLVENSTLREEASAYGYRISQCYSPPVINRLYLEATAAILDAARSEKD